MVMFSRRDNDAELSRTCPGGTWEGRGTRRHPAATVHLPQPHWRSSRGGRCQASKLAPATQPREGARFGAALVASQRTLLIQNWVRAQAQRLPMERRGGSRSSSHSPSCCERTQAAANEISPPKLKVKLLTKTSSVRVGLTKRSWPRGGPAVMSRPPSKYF